jgi:hypothetical protein
METNHARTFWRLAKIETLIPSKDKIVRSVMVKVLGNDKKKPILLRKPIQHLVPLEVSSKLDWDKFEIKNHKHYSSYILFN